MQKKVWFKNKRKEKLAGLVDYPKIKGKLPTVILVHGFGVDKQESGLFDQIARALNKVEILVYRFDFPGCGESEGDYETMTLARQVKDLEEIINFVKRQKLVDRTRIGILAQSFGTPTTVVLAPKNIRTFVLMGSTCRPYPVLRRLFGRGYNPKGTSVRVKSSGKKIKVKADFWKNLKKKDLLKSIKKIKSPILFIHGEKDEKVSPAQARLWYRVANKPKRLVIIPKANHGLAGQLARRQTIKEVTNWFKKYLK